MKKQILNTICVVVALGALLALQSCEKENYNGYRIYATIQQYNGEKVHIEHGTQHAYSCWDDGDEVRMHSETGTLHIDGSNCYIEFDHWFANAGQDGHSQAHPILAALYPTYFLSTADSRDFEALDRDQVSPNLFHIHLEPTQLYELSTSGYQKLEAPMVAVLPGGDYYPYNPNAQNSVNAQNPIPTMQFKNVCAMLEVTVNSDDPIVVTRIEVENTGIGTGDRHIGRPLWGDFEITFDNTTTPWEPILREQSDVTQDLAADFVTKEVTLECEHHGDQGGVSVSGSHPFYIFVPPVEYQDLHVTVYAKTLDDNNQYVEKCITLISNVHSTFQANTMYPLSVTYDDNSWITVPRSHELGPFRVSDNKWVKFAFSNVHHDGTGYFLPPYQYDYIGYHDPNGDHDFIPYTEIRSILIDDPSSTTERPVETPYVNLGIAGYNTNNNWMILTHEEWNYLLRRRTGNCFTYAIVASVPGIILFPDGFTTPAGFTTPLNSVNNDQAAFASTIISIPQFYLLETAGCVFLPCVSYTNGQATTISDVGKYWEYRNYVGRWTSILTLAPGNIGQTEWVSSESAFLRLAHEVAAPSK